jgi:uncharacterized membrane protein YraQ (UPF0718 family)
LKAKSVKLNDECKIHGSSSRTVNKTLLILLLASLSLIIWHLWLYGPTAHVATPELSQKSFLVLLGSEIWDLIFDSRGVVAELQDVLPYFLFGIFLAGLIRTYKLAIKMRNSLIRFGFLSIFLASVVGVLTPLCACGILTTAMTLMFAGVPLAPVMALLVSSPLISPSAYLLTLNDLGPQWTVIRTVAAFSMGIFAGVVAHLIRNRGFQIEKLFIEGSIPRGDFHDPNYPEDSLKCNCKEKFGNRVARKTDNKFIIFWAKSSDMLWMVGKYVLVGITVGAIVERYLPSEWLHNLFGREGQFNIVWITLGTVPIFLHQISASSILYHIKSSLDGTLNGGAGLAFLIGGPVTAIPAMIMLWTMFKKRVFALYMFICIIGTIMLAYSFQYFVIVPNIDMDNPLLRGVTSISGGRSVVMTKVNKDVKIVMDPGGHNMVATSVNEMEGRGGIVFEAGFERFLNQSAGRYDNSQYITNIAEWLEDHNNSLNAGSILIYNTFRESGLDNSVFNKNAPVLLKQQGEFNVAVTDRTETPELSAALLDQYSQLWIILGESGQDCCFSDDELARIAGFNGDGSSMLIIAGNELYGSEKDLTSANRVSSRFGVTYSGTVENAEKLTVSSLSNFFNRVSGILERMYRFVT